MTKQQKIIKHFKDAQAMVTKETLDTCNSLFKLSVPKKYINGKTHKYIFDVFKDIEKLYSEDYEIQIMDPRLTMCDYDSGTLEKFKLDVVVYTKLNSVLEIGLNHQYLVDTFQLYIKVKIIQLMLMVLVLIG